MKKFDEDRYIKEITDYVNATYNQHYSGQTGTQAFELIAGNGMGEAFSVGNILKYASRYGKKGTKRSQLLKIAHYAILALYALDLETKIEEEKGSGTTFTYANNVPDFLMPSKRVVV